MRRVLRWITAPILAIERVGGRGAGRWARTPAGVQVGLIVGLVLAENAWDAAPWAALTLFLWSLPGWIERVTPGVVKRLLAAIRRDPLIAFFAISAPWSMIHQLSQAGLLGGGTGMTGAAAGVLLVFALGIPPEADPIASAGRRPGQVQGAVPAFVKLPTPRLSHAGPALLTLGGAGMVIIGTFLPWASWSSPLTGPTTVNGLHGPDPMLTDRMVTVTVGVAIALAAAARLSARGHAGWRRGVAIAGGLGLVTLAYWIEGSIAAQFAGSVPPAAGSSGPGLVMVGLGGALALIGGLIPGRPARLATDRLLGSATAFAGTRKAPGRLPSARG